MEKAMKPFKVIKSGKKVFIQVLCYNNRQWCESMWFYGYVRKGDYPTDIEKYATDFETVEAANEWIANREV